MASTVLTVASEHMFDERVFVGLVGQGFAGCDQCHSGNARNCRTVPVDSIIDRKGTA